MLNAMRAAVGAGRPLLVEGEPGAGKSHFARAAASLCNRHFMSVVIQPNTEYEELLWTVDHTERLGRAHRPDPVPIAGDDFTGDPLDIRRFVCPGPLWYAFDFYGPKPPNRSQFRQLESDDSKLVGNGVVLLIDEIDKADASLCNGLLEAFGNGGFEVPLLAQSVRCPPDRAPLIVLTSNRTRTLPAAFLRRCVIHRIVLPEGEALVEHLVALGEVQFAEDRQGPLLHDSTLREAAKQIVRDRQVSGAESQVRAGVAEYLDLLRAIDEHALPGASEQSALLRDIAAFFHKRY